VHMLRPFCMAAAFIPDYLWDCADLYAASCAACHGEQYKFSFHRGMESVKQKMKFKFGYRTDR
jgi:hypothetical protein